MSSISMSSSTCMFCNKYYKTKEKMYKHMVLCETMHRARNRKLIIEDNEDELIVPSPKKMYQIILDLAVKCNKMEQELQEMKKWVDKKKRKINVLDWLNSNVYVDSTFDTLTDRIEIIDYDIQFLLRNSFYDTLYRIFERSIFKNIHFQMKDDGKIFVSYPLFSFTHKQNILYVFTDNGNDGKKWIECHRDSLSCLFNNLHMKMVRKLMEWKKKNADKMTCGYSDDIYNETVIKLMDIDFKSDSTFCKIRSSIYQHIKINVNDIKTPNMILDNSEFE